MPLFDHLIDKVGDFRRRAAGGRQSQAGRRRSGNALPGGGGDKRKLLGEKRRQHFRERRRLRRTLLFGFPQTPHPILPFLGGGAGVPELAHRVGEIRFQSVGLSAPSAHAQKAEAPIHSRSLRPGGFRRWLVDLGAQSQPSPDRQAVGKVQQSAARLSFLLLCGSIESEKKVRRGLPPRDSAFSRSSGLHYQRKIYQNPEVTKSKSQYEALWTTLSKTEKAAEAAVGGDFDAIGALEFQLLKLVGLTRDSSVVDVGCGSGRLAKQLTPWLRGPYLGTDILPPLLEHARRITGRPDWRFEPTDGERIPADDETADMICFFSVMTHITHEETWRYILDAKRVAKPGAKIVCSFLEFRIRGCWAVFREDVKDRSPNKVLNQFLSRDAFEAFAFNAGLTINAFFDGDKPHIPIEGEMAFANGHRMSGMGNLGQSICVIEKPSIPLPLPS
ncbi:MAG: class I SAM-dependent methyltransferase [Opitutaceae bacterium]